MIALSTSPQAALKAAKQLVGCYPHSKPPEPETYAAALAAVLAQYPIGVVTECVDPRTGLARDREFPPTVAALVAWLDKRLAWHQAVATHVARLSSPPRIFTEEEERLGRAAMRGLSKAIKAGEPLDGLTFEEAVKLGSGPQQQAAE